MKSFTEVLELSFKLIINLTTDFITWLKGVKVLMPFILVIVVINLLVLTYYYITEKGEIENEKDDEIDNEDNDDKFFIINESFSTENGKQESSYQRVGYRTRADYKKALKLSKGKKRKNSPNEL